MRGRGVTSAVSHSSAATLEMGPFLGLITTIASMVALINSIMAAVGVTLLAGMLFREKQTLLASPIGSDVGLMLMAAFFAGILRCAQDGSLP